MASREGCKLLGENKDGSYDSISNSGSSANSKVNGDNDKRGFTRSCPPVLEPSRDESRTSDGRTKNRLMSYFTRSCPQPLTLEVSISSSGESHEHEDEHRRSGEHQGTIEQQTDEPKILEQQQNCCAKFLSCYKNCAHTIGLSWFIYIFQFFIGLLCISAIIMGIVFFRSCEGRYPSADPLFTIFTGISGLFLVYKWMAKVCRQRRGDYFWNYEKNRLIMLLLAVLFFMAIAQANSKGVAIGPTLRRSTVHYFSDLDLKQSKTFYDYLYYMHIADAGALGLAALLYLPDCCIYIYAYERLVPSQSNGHYQPL